MTNFEIRDRNGNWHLLESGLFYIGGRGHVLTYFVEGYDTCYEEHHIDAFLESGIVRELEEIDDLFFDTIEQDSNVPVTGAALLRTSQRQMPGVPA